MKIAWNTGQSFRVSYAELRFRCPCSRCVDENTGERIIRRESIQKGVRPTEVHLVGRYAIQIHWNDRHSTGIYPFEMLLRICEECAVATGE